MAHPRRGLRRSSPGNITSPGVLLRRRLTEIGRGIRLSLGGVSPVEAAVVEAGVGRVLCFPGAAGMALPWGMAPFNRRGRYCGRPSRPIGRGRLLRL